MKVLQKVLEDIEGWASVWGFKISSYKTEAIIFRKTRGLKLDNLKLTLFGTTLKFAKHVKFLGMIFDERLTWNEHIKYLIERCNKDMNVLRLVSGTTFGADKVTLLRLYKALILSKIDYGSQAYNSANASELGKLDKIQNQAMQIATRALKARGTQLTSPENFFIFCIRVHFEVPNMKMKRKRYLPVLVFLISAFKII